MTRLQIYRGIAVIASIASLGPQAVLGESSSSSPIFSSRFLSSLEQQDAATVEDERSRTTLNNELISNENNNRSQRRELSWWALALQLVHPPCLPHERHRANPPKHCLDADGAGSGGSGGGGSSSGSGSGSSSGSSSGNSSGSDSGASGSGGASEKYTQKSAVSPGSLPFWMLIAAASAAAIAVGAIIVGSRRKAKDRYHPLKGSLERRMRLFGGMAEECFEERELCRAQSGNGLEMGGGGSGGLVNGEAEYKEMV
ncbi:hypothetical protein ACHAXR_002200 [Thalassiosira sp. AJA248-18]